MPAPFGCPAICLVTDRRRLPGGQERALLRLSGLAAAAGVDLIHLRERDLDDRRLLALAQGIVEIGREVRVVINDRPDIALAAGAAGVHLRHDGLPPAQVRRILPPPLVIGCSVHTVTEAVAAVEGGAEYLIAGTVYATSSKRPGSALLGPAGLAAICAAVTIPVLAIGGITLDRIAEAADAGAAGVAAVGLFTDIADTVPSERQPEALARLVNDLRQGFRRMRDVG